jgi:hypothetical protein
VLRDEAAEARLVLSRQRKYSWAHAAIAIQLPNTHDFLAGLRGSRT